MRWITRKGCWVWFPQTLGENCGGAVCSRGGGCLGQLGKVSVCNEDNFAILVKETFEQFGK